MKKPQPEWLGLLALVGPHGLEPWTKGFYRFQLSLLKFKLPNQNFSCDTDYLTTFYTECRSIQRGQASGAQGGH